MDGRCERHQFEAAIGLCDFCGEEFCGECLVRPFGNKKPPLCIPCTISQSGLRATTKRRRKLSKKEKKEIEERLGQQTPTVLSATEAALMSAGKPGRHASAAGKEPKKGGGRFSRKKGADEAAESSAPTIKAITVEPSAPPAAAAPQPQLQPEPESAVPTGVGMTAPGAEEIDWSKPFDVNG